MRDIYQGRFLIADIANKGRRSDVGQSRARWAAHLNVDEARLLEFLGAVRFTGESSEARWNEWSLDKMNVAGLRADEEALAVGRALVREWVKTGAGPQSREQIKRQVADRQLLARPDTLVFAVHAIDHDNRQTGATIEMDVVDLYTGQSRSRATSSLIQTTGTPR